MDNSEGPPTPIANANGPERVGDALVGIRSRATKSSWGRLRRRAVRFRHTARGDDGYALVAAVTSVLAFAYIAFQVLAADEGGVGAVSARIEQAKLSAAADAGIALAVQALANPDRGARWSLDGRPHEADFAGDSLTIVVEDERGKAPLITLNDGQVRALFSGAGAQGEQLDALVAEYRDWVSDPATGAEAVTEHLPPSDGRLVRHGPMLTVGELALLPDMTPTVYARVARVVTVFFEESGPFNAGHASPLAKAAMNGDTLTNPDELDSEAQVADQQPDTNIADDNLVGNTLTVRVVARDRRGDRTHRMAIVELTGDLNRPYWVRYVE